MSTTTNTKITDIYRSNYISADLMASEGIFIIKSKGHCPRKDFKGLLQEVGQHAKKYQVGKWFLDLQNFSASPEDIDWVVDEWIPKITKTIGCKHYIAFTFPENVIYQFGFSRRLNKLFPSGCLHIMPIAAKAHAVKWLQECDQ
ncbi:hypothetical protein [Microscilla marina]|uniref:STAS/SEC14 domain-containing protein n=1 Tax=Microscilla marina ATCC 23134 TaxID=313606 RepID=A1ZYQ2_MICM2|nr:hypothetical protein [Microscilla marina]EAY24476.1 hypothetical protein M23134_06463 [Microscilla marina ATCC 23134]